MFNSSTFCDIKVDFDDLFKTCDVIIPTVVFADSVREQYSKCHNVADFDLMRDIVSEYKEFRFDWKCFSESHYLSIGNMFIMRKEDFEDYCRFVYFCLDMFIEERGFRNMDDVTDYIKNNLGDYLKLGFSEEYTLSYQSKMIGFLQERLTTLYIFTKLRNVAIAGII